MSISDEFGDTPLLRQVALCGPMAGAGAAAWPMWVLRAAAPAFKYRNAYGPNEQPAGTTADYAHPLRVLSADAPDAKRGMRPRLMSVHLLLGARNAVYRQFGEKPGDANEKKDRDRLLMGWTSDVTVTANATYGRMLRSKTEGPDASDGAAPFVHVTTELLPDGLPWLDGKPAPDGWDSEESGDDVIALAPMRLVAGRIGLYVNPRSDGMAWLGKLGIVGWDRAGKDWHSWPCVWLVPDGIEFDATPPFPGRVEGAAALAGRVLLHPDSDSVGQQGFRLTLVEATDAPAWWRAWREIVPGAGDGSESLTGLRFGARGSGALPAFSWPVSLVAGEPAALAARTVEVAGGELAISLASPLALGVVDSVATLRLGRVPVAEVTHTGANGAERQLVSFSLKVPPPQGAAGPDLLCTCTPELFTLSLPIPPAGAAATPLRLDIEAARLAGELRSAYGIEAPPPVPAARAAGLWYGERYARPLLAAFVALDDGWLQLPVPNLGPLDTSSDQALASTSAAATASVFDGFLRLRHAGLGPEVQSGYKPARTPARGRGAPWALTVERAAGVCGEVRVLPRGAGAGAAGALASATLTLKNTVLSARGLLWLSADRPDAREALPRLGAGPAAFIDALMQSATGGDAERSPLMASFGSFAISIARDQRAIPATLTWDHLALHFRTNSKRWQHEVLKPREARQALQRAGACITDDFPGLQEDTQYGRHMVYVQLRSGLLRAHLSNAATNLPRMRPSLDALAQVPAVKMALAPAIKGLAEADTGTRTALNLLVKVSQALSLASAALPPDQLQSRPVPAVAWLRHPVIPAVTTMPMTRAASGSSRPLESRDLLPYALLNGEAIKKPGNGLLILAQLRPVAGSPLLQLDDGAVNAFALRPVRRWPHAGLAGNARPERGIGMAAVGIAGVELRPRPLPLPNNMTRAFEAAVRLDLPLLDEAFATAALPPPADAATAPVATADSVATALDWPLLVDFWQAQQRKQQNCRVVDSYLSGYAATDADTTVDVTTLVRGLTWSTRVKVATTAVAVASAPPFGSLDIGDMLASSGNTALAGYSGAFTPDLTRRTLTPAADAAAGTLAVLGFSPATFDVGDIALDNSMAGAGPATCDAVGQVMVRPVTFADQLGVISHELRSLTRPEQFMLGAHRFEFWFKDVLFNGDEARLATPAPPLELDALAFDTLDRDAALAASGFEWRLAPAEPGDRDDQATLPAWQQASIALALGRNELLLGGLRLEPLRLIKLTMAAGRVATATLQCRLLLDPRNDPANLVLLHLEKLDAQLAAHLTLADPDSPLVFGFDIHDPLAAARGQPLRRRVSATAVPSAKGSSFGLVGRAMEVQVADTMVALGPPVIALGDGRDGCHVVTITQRAAGNPAGAPGCSRLRIESAALTAGFSVHSDKTSIGVLRELPAQLTWRHLLEIFPAGDHANPALPAIAWDLGEDPGLTLLGLRFSSPAVEVKEGNGAIVATARNAKYMLGKTELVTADGALLARLGAQPAAPDGTIALAGGVAEALISQIPASYTSVAGDPLFGPGLRIEGGRMALLADGDGAGKWRGSVSVSAQIAAASDIAWPSVSRTDGLAVPLPRQDKKPNSGRVGISVGTAGVARHDVRWVLDGHRLALDLAAALGQKKSAALWVTPVVAHHTLRRDTTALCWSGVEALAAGRPAGLLPPLPPDLLKDATTLAPRYAHAIVAGVRDNHPEAGMARAGVGAVATVLQGALGRTFRSLYRPSEQTDRIMLAGGFLGLLKLDENAATLLRLPVLAGSSLALDQSDLGAMGADLAWNDGTAMRAIAITRPTAPSPASAAFEAVAAAVAAGSLPRRPAPTDADADITAMTAALLLEQSYGNTPAGSAPSLTGTPFFLAAAVSVSAVLDAAPQSDAPVRPDSLSLVSGVLARAGAAQALAASVPMRAGQPMTSAPRARATLHILGAGMHAVDWPHATSADNAAQLEPYLRALAPGHDPDPAGFLLVLHDQAGAVTYVGGVIASLALDRSTPPATRTAAFTDGRRGLPAMPRGDDLMRWLAPPRESAAAPIRDAVANAGAWQGSGVAGLARQMTLPAHSAAAWDIDNRAAPTLRPAQLVWLCSTQVPVYLPQHISGLRGTPPAWLQPAPPLVRLPTDTEVVDAIRASRQAPQSPAAAAFQVQPFLPGHVAHAAVGERAGILTLRRTRLLTRLDAGTGTDITAFDASQVRFGAPGQGGSSWARKLRTPRPGPLPANRGDAARDRRIQASRVRPLDWGSALLGSADIVQGGAGSFAGCGAFEAWSIQVVACPESASVVSERWDGVLQLVCRVEVRLAGTAPAGKPGFGAAQFLAAALFDDGEQLGALLKIDQQVIRYRWLKQRPALGKWRTRALVLPGQEAVSWYACAAEVTLLLDPREAPFEAAEPAPFAPIAAALAARTGTPRMELQWTVVPRSGNHTLYGVNQDIALALPDPALPALVTGSIERPSLTLRMPLYPVLQSQGALPLTPATLIFSDPAYDRDLAGPPASARLALQVSATDELDARGDLRMILYADRGRVNRQGVVTLMLDIAYERRMDELAQAAAEQRGAVPGGDLLQGHGMPQASLVIHVVAAGQAPRLLRFGSATPAALLISVANVYELPLAQLVELDGGRARLAPGDLLQIDAVLLAQAVKGVETPAHLWHTGKQAANQVRITVPPGDDAPHCMLALTLTEEAVVEPPPALYLALQRGPGATGQVRMSVPLHAQSPLPGRVDLADPARGFRSGLLQRHADFVWYLSSTDAMLGPHSLLPIKSDRNGQGYWPEAVAELLTPENYYSKPGTT